jgi:hypothetical protein
MNPSSSYIVQEALGSLGTSSRGFLPPVAIAASPGSNLACYAVAEAPPDSIVIKL